jgi:hypothetical protein
MNKEKHINITTFDMESEIKVISSNFNGNNNFALVEKENKLILTPLKKYDKPTERKQAETDLKRIYNDNDLKNFIYVPFDTQFSRLLTQNSQKDGTTKKILFSQESENSEV